MRAVPGTFSTDKVVVDAVLPSDKAPKLILTEADICRISGADGLYDTMQVSVDPLLPVSQLFADEPTGNLDRGNADAVIELLCRLCRVLNQTALIVTHGDRICARADRVLTMVYSEIMKETRHSQSILES